MSYEPPFDRPILVPQHTLAACRQTVGRVERLLGFKREEHRGAPARWESTDPADDVTDKSLCDVARAHNRWVSWLDAMFVEWAKATPDNPPRGVWAASLAPDDPPLFNGDNWGRPMPPPDTITPDEARSFWHGVTPIPVPPQRWTRSYYRDRMDLAYEVMRGHERDGTVLGAKRLSTSQASAVVRLFAAWLDCYDLALDVPRGRDYLATSFDGGYDYCEQCGPVVSDDADHCRAKACPERARRDADFLADERPELARRWVVKDKGAQTYLGRMPGEWHPRITKRVLRFNLRDEAVRQVGKFPLRTLVVVPVRGRR